MDKETKDFLDASLAQHAAKLNSHQIMLNIWLAALTVCGFVYVCLDKVVITVPCGA